MLHLDVDELSWIKGLDHKLRLAHASLALPKCLSLLQISQFLMVANGDIVGEIKSIFHLKTSLLRTRCLDCPRRQRWKLNVLAI